MRISDWSSDVCSSDLFYGAEPYANAYTNIGSSKFVGARISALFQPTPDLTLLLSYLSQKTELNGNALANSGTYEQALFDVAPEHVIRGQKSGACDMEDRKCVVCGSSAAVRVDHGGCGNLEKKKNKKES